MNEVTEQNKTKQEEATQESHQEREYCGLYHVWSLLPGALLVSTFAWNSPLDLFGSVKDFCLLIMGMTALLFLIILVTGRIYWVVGISYEQAQAVGAQNRRRYAGINFLLFLAAAVIYLGYCLWEPVLLTSPSSIRDSLVAGAVLCLAWLGSREVRLEKEK